MSHDVVLCLSDIISDHGKDMVVFEDVSRTSNIFQNRHAVQNWTMSQN